VNDYDYTSAGGIVDAATNALLAAGIPWSAIWYTNALETATIIPGVSTNFVNYAHPTGATNVAGYISWGVHSSLLGYYSTNGTVKWTGTNRWWIIETIESFNGQRQTFHGHPQEWFSPNAFGGTNYSNTQTAIPIPLKKLPGRAVGLESVAIRGRRHFSEAGEGGGLDILLRSPANLAARSAHHV
jgi:hypothetical protein